MTLHYTESVLPTDVLECLETMKEGYEVESIIQFIDEVIKSNNLYLLDKHLNNLLMYASPFPEETSILLKHVKIKNIETNELNQNIFHFLARDNYHETLKNILKNDEFKVFAQAKDLYGNTPLDLANEFKHKESIECLSLYLNTDVQEESQVPADLSQSNLNEILKQYLEMTGRKGENIINDYGNCAGWSFLYEIYSSIGEEEYFFEILNFISTLNIEKEISLTDSFIHINSQKLPARLKEKYESTENLLENLISNLVFLQSSANIYNETELGLHALDRKEEYELIKDPQLNRKLESICKINAVFLNQSQLKQILHSLTSQGGINIEFCFSPFGQLHLTSAYIGHDKKIHYYDSNFKKKMVPLSEDMLAEHIFKLLKKSNGGNEGYMFDVIVNKFISNDEHYVPQKLIASPSFEKNNPLGFSKLHHAIITNDIKLFDKNLHLINETDQLGSTPLMWAIRMKNKQMIDRLLHEKDLQINSKDKQKNSALMLAIKNREHEIASTLLQYNINANETDKNEYTPILIAVALGKTSILDKLIEKTNEKNLKEALAFSVINENINAVKILIEKKDLNSKIEAEGKTLINYAIENNCNYMIPFLIKKGCSLDISIHYALKENKSEMLFTLYQYGASFNEPIKGDKTPLEFAITNCNKQMVNTLLALGADLEEAKDIAETVAFDLTIKKSKEKSIEDIIEVIYDYIYFSNAIKENNLTLVMEYLEKEKCFSIRLEKEIELHPEMTKTIKNILLKIALEEHNLEKIKKCIEGGADVNIQSAQGMTALMIATIQPDPTFMKELIKKNASLEQEDKEGKTALLWASVTNNISSMKLLCKHNANINAIDKKNRNALFFASLYEHHDIIRYIMKNKINLDVQRADLLESIIKIGNKSLIRKIKENAIKNTIKINNTTELRNTKWNVKLNSALNRKSYTPFNLNLPRPKREKTKALRKEKNKSRHMRKGR